MTQLKQIGGIAIAKTKPFYSPAFVRFSFITYLWFTSQHRDVTASSQRRFLPATKERADRGAYWELLLLLRFDDEYANQLHGALPPNGVWSTEAKK